MKTLKEIYENYKGPDGWGDKGTAHTYIDEYEHLLKPYRKNSTILEIGMAFGHSMEMWCDYFVDSNVVGVDITNHGIPENTRYKQIFCDATTNDIISHISNYKFDVIIDDGSHNPKDQISSFNILKNYMKETGIYIIEDVYDFNTINSYFQSIKDVHDVEIIDNRSIKGRNDDVLIIIKKF